MAERNPLVEEWILKAEGDWDWTEIDVALITPRMSDGYVYHLQQCVEKLFKARLGGVPPSGVNPWAQHRRSRC